MNLSCLTVYSVLGVWQRVESRPFRAAGRRWTQARKIRGNRAYTTLHSPGTRYIYIYIVS